jgi:diamine N-acetyltransferase
MIRLVREFSHRQREWRNDPEVRQHVRQSGIISEAEHQAWICGLHARKDCIYFGIEASEDSKVKGFIKKPEIVGYCGLSSIELDPMRCHATAEYSILIGPEFQGKGYGKQAVKQLLDYAFQTIGLAKVWGEILEENEGGLGLAESCGFTREGLLVGQYYKRGDWKNAVRVGLLRNDYRA